MLAHLTNLVATAQARMLAQYKDATKFVADVGAVVDEAQAVEDAFWSFFGQLQLNPPAGGVWVDRIGAYVGLARGGLSDADYNSLIASMVAANKSQGTSEDVLAALTPWAQVRTGGTNITWTDQYPAAQFGTISDGITQRDMDLVTPIITRARAIGVNTQVGFQAVDDQTSFMMDDSTAPGTAVGKGFDDSTSPGNTNAGQMAGVIQA